MTQLWVVEQLLCSGNEPDVYDVSPGIFELYWSILRRCAKIDTEALQRSHADPDMLTLVANERSRPLFNPHDTAKLLMQTQLELHACSVTRRSRFETRLHV